MDAIVVELKKHKETKGTRVFEDEGGEQAIRSLYIQKLGIPADVERIRVTVEALD